MRAFLQYFNKIRIDNKELNSTNFNYLCDPSNKNNFKFK